MTPAKLAKQKQALLDLKSELQTHGFERPAPNRGSEAEAGDNDDEQPLNEMMQSVASGRNRNHAQMLGQIKRALIKLRDEPEDYGVCEDCNEDIAAPRLAALPFAPLCVACQSKRDGPRAGPTRRKLTEYR